MLSYEVVAIVEQQIDSTCNNIITRGQNLSPLHLHKFRNAYTPKFLVKARMTFTS